MKFPKLFKKAAALVMAAVTTVASGNTEENPAE